MTLPLSDPLAVTPPVMQPPVVPAPVMQPPVMHPAAPVSAAVPPPVAPPAASRVGVAEAAAHDLDLDEALRVLVARGGSDLHLSAGAPPMMRVHGRMLALPGMSALTATEIQACVYAIITERQKQRFEEARELDFAYALRGAARFRVNLMWQQGAVGAVFRAIPWEITPLESLGMPEVVGTFADLPRGLVLVTGPTGSGKSTTLASIIDRANGNREGHIVTIEDPIEFVHRHRSCVVNQREVGLDTLSFQDALKHALRQDPDIILVGELRDLETIAIALTAAETGHLVLATLHTSSAPSTIDRVIDVFPAGQQAQIRAQLAGSLAGIVCQALCRTADGQGRVAATEVLVATPAVRNLIREGKLPSLPSALQTGSRFGMHTLNQSLAGLVSEGRITYETAREHCSDAAELHQLLGMAPDATG